MSRASISELKARLSHYLREVRRGGEVEVLDRGVPVARLTAVEAPAGGPDSERRARLVRAGMVRPGSGETSAILEETPLAVSASILEALEEERADRL